MSFYTGVDGKTYWHVHARNGKIVSDGSQGYKQQAGAEKGLRATYEALKEYFGDT